MKLLCIHPALAPYRLDFFNMLAERVDLEVAFVHKNAINQKFDQEKLLSKARFKFRYLKGFDIGGRNVRFGVSRLIRELQPDVVLGYEASPITVWLCLLRKLCRAKWRLWTHIDTIASRKGLRRMIRDFVIRSCDGITAPSASAAEAYRSVLIPHLSAIASAAADPSSPIPHPPAPPLLHSSPFFAIVPIIHDTAAIRKNAERVIELGKEWKSGVAPNGERILLYVGRLATVKNLYWLLGQIRQSALLRNIITVFVGDGPEREGLKSKVGALGLDARVQFVGRKDGDELYAIMSAADALVLPSTFEPYGAVVAEAMQWGTPVVVSDKVGAKELISDGKNGAVIGSDFWGTVMQVMKLKRGCDSILGVELKDAVKDLVTSFSRG